MSPFHHKTQFTSEELACAIVGVTSYKENRDEVSLWTEEIDLAFPPVIEQKPACGYGSVYLKEEKKYSPIPREQALAFCEQHGIRPPLLFPNDPPDSLSPADSSQFKKSDLLLTIHRLLLLVKDLDNENIHLANAKKYARRKYVRGDGVSHKAVWEGIEEVLARLEVSTAGLGETKTRTIFSAACRLGEEASKEKEY